MRRHGRWERLVESEHVGLVQAKVKRGPVLADMCDGSRLGNRADSVLGENPGERHARRTYAVAAGDASHVYPLSQAWTTSILHAGQFTAACGAE